MFKLYESTGNVMDILLQHTSMSTCNRGRVAAVLDLPPDYNSCVIGYSHSMTEETCDSDGHIIECDHCVRTIHAEAMAVAKAASMGLCTKGAACYVTRLPCEACIRTLKCAGVTTIVVYETVKATAKEWADRMEYAKRVGIRLTNYNNV